jgi:phosphoribosyl-ATP pyrophosphohydrolase/phosphoribosyl-AMP cyclohydrolase
MSTVEPLWDERGLVPAVAQDATTGAVLMVAWMNRDALALTRSSGFAHFWSRSRAAMWKKGETSGHTLAVVDLRIDCDADTILMRVQPAGPACHTGAPTCFFRDLAGAPTAPAGSVLDALEAVIAARRDHATGEKSYTRSLLDAGWPKILAKIAEEHGELAAELPDGPDDQVVYETADLLFHVMVGLGARRIPIARVLVELARRFGVSGHVEKAARPPKTPEG